MSVVLRCAEAPAWTPWAYSAAHWLRARGPPWVCAATTHFPIAGWIARGIVASVVLCKVCATSR